MPNCHLILDSCCDLPVDLLLRDDVRLLKFPYIVDGGTFEDDLFQTTSAHDFYELMRKGTEPSTAQLSVPQLTEVFTAAAEEGMPAVYLSFTSGLSGSYDAAVLVRDQILKEYPDFQLYVVDTKLPSIAEGVLVYEALRQMDKGLSAKELADWAEEARYFVDCEFMVEDLEALRRGGRIPSGVAVAGSKLDVKPLLTVDNITGKLQLVGVARGRKKGIKALAEYFEKNIAEDDLSHYCILGGADADKDLQRLRDAITKIDENIYIVEASIGPVIGTHVGPGMLAVAFWGSDQREKLSVADRIARRVKGGK